MARARNIKPGFFQNPELGELSPLERLCFIGMWTISDFKGCIEFKAKRMKIQLLPYDECCIEKIVINLERAGLIRTYSVQGQLYIKIINFVKHQNPHKNERDAGSNIPDVDQHDDSFEEKRNEYRELGKITIKTDKIGKNPEQDGTNPADSLLLIPDSLNLNPDSVMPQSRQVAQPSAKKQKVELDYSVWPEQPDQQILNDWLQLRSSKKAKVSQTVLNAFSGELRKAATFGYSVNDCLTVAISSGWTGFKFEWVQNQQARGIQGGSNQPKPSLIDRFIANNYGPVQNDNRPMGGDDRTVRDQVVEPIRGNPGRLGPMESDLIGDFKATGGGCFE